MKEDQQSLILKTSSRFPPPQGVKLSYGTAGFRADASLLESTLFRVGILAALRSIKTQSVIGLMITASHNKVSDNGVKIADPSGGMLTQAWEPFADQLATASSDPNHLLSVIMEFVKTENIQLGQGRSAEILLARDTRPSGENLLEAAKQGICSILGSAFIDSGVLTTPQLHWMVRCRNKGVKASDSDYFEQISSSFTCLMDLIPKDNNLLPNGDKVVVDCANGVGGEKLERLKTMLVGLNMDIDIRNTGENGGVLNEGVGADFVQKEKVLPSGFGDNDVNIRCASLDGDADRLVYFYTLPNENDKIDLVDGDKILALFALFINAQLVILNSDVCGKGKPNSSVVGYQPCLGVVQTAYANGASTDYFKKMGIEVAITPTGVKYLHEKALEYDIGIYFEANGHGTILFSDIFLKWLETREANDSGEQKKAALRLLAVSKLINQAVGDALSGLLLVEAILRHMAWSIQKWNAIYRDLPSRQLKVRVVDRTAVVTTNAETVVVQPRGIQEAIDAEVVKYQKGRAFIRASGTEDVIRVYAEASTQADADSLAKSVAQLVDEYLGIGTST